MQKVKRFLKVHNCFIAGVLLTSAFLADNAAQLSIVTNIIYKEYEPLCFAVDQLEDQKSVPQGTKGFKELSEFVLKDGDKRELKLEELKSISVSTSIRVTNHKEVDDKKYVLTYSDNSVDSFAISADYFDRKLDRRAFYCSFFCLRQGCTSS